MNEMKKNIKKYWFFYSSGCILLLATFLRFYDYGNRWVLQVDQTSFALHANYALFHHKLPLFGQFASAGPFQAGGEWYWFLMIAQAFFPFSILTQWVVLTSVYVIFVLLIIMLGERLINKQYGLVVGLLAAVSTSQIVQSANLTNQSPIPLITLFAIWMSVNYIRTKKSKYIFLLGLFSGLAPTFHPQGFILLFLIFMTVVFSGRPNIKHLFLVEVGLFIPWIPVFIGDSYNHFTNTQNMIRYYLHDQYKIPFESLGRRWLTYLGVFWPNGWAYIVGGNMFIAYVQLVLLIIFAVFETVKKRIPKEILVILLSFIAMVYFLRYARTPLYDSYLLTLHPLIFLLSGWVIYMAYKYNKYAGIMLLIIVTSFSLVKSITEYKRVANTDMKVLAVKYKNILVKALPNKKFAMYDYQNKTAALSQSVTLLLGEENKLDDNGMKVGMVIVPIATSDAQFTQPQKAIYGGKGEYQFLDLNSSSSATLMKNEWVPINPSAIYRSVQEWYLYKKL
jgi:4-amino-4-deoxy-L-arabinose transferase-like glycosyltransferase